MKKAIVLLLALALVAVSAFAEGAEVVVTGGVSAYAGINVLNEDAEFGSFDSADDPGAIGRSYFVAPWVKLTKGVFYSKYGVEFARTASNDITYSVENGISSGDYLLKSVLTVKASVVTNTVTASAAKDNLSAAVVVKGTSATTSLDTVLLAPFTATALTDYYFQIKDLWDFVDVKLGGIANNYAVTFRMLAIGNDFWPTSDYNSSGVGRRWTKTTLPTLPITTTYNLDKLIDLPLTVKTGFKVPETAASFDTYFNGTSNNAIFAVDYKADAFALDFGFLPSQDSEVFFDFNFGGVENLALQAGLYAQFADELALSAGVEAVYTVSDAIKVDASFGFATESDILVGLGLAYTLDDRNSVSLRNVFEKTTASLDTISLGYTHESGGGSLDINAFYELNLDDSSLSTYGVSFLYNLSF